MIRWYDPGINTIGWLRWQQVCNVFSWSIQSSMSSLPSIDVSSTSNPVSFPKIVIRHFSGFRIQRNCNTTIFQSSEYLEQFFDKFHERNSQAVQGNPPKAATGWVAAVGHIHLILLHCHLGHGATQWWLGAFPLASPHMSSRSRLSYCFVHQKSCCRNSSLCVLQ